MKSKDLDRVHGGGHARRVVGGVDQHGRAGAHPLQTPRRADGGEGRADRLLLDRPGRGAGTEERLDGGQRGHRVLGLVRPEQRQEDLLVLAAQALQAHLLATHCDATLQHAELGALPRDDRLDVDGPADQGVERPRLLVGEHRDGVGLDDPGSSPAIVATSAPRYSAWSRSTGVTTATRASATPVSHVLPMPTSITATSTGASANSAYAMPTMTSKKDNGTSLPASTICT